MIIAGKHIVPNHCPENCPFLNEISVRGQNTFCGYCPVFVCHKDEYRGCFVEPEKYREDWALAWSNWFADGMKGIPVIEIERKLERYCYD